jgi:dihydropteroate synthase
MKLMGIVNITPDSFYDGGFWTKRDDAIRHGLKLFQQGAHIVDVGGESTRPGAKPVTYEEEVSRVLPVVRELAKNGRVSIDTRHSAVALAAIEAGASMINDVSCQLYGIAGEAGVDYVAMHMQGQPGNMQEDPNYDDVVLEVCDTLQIVARRAQAAGVRRCWVDPGIGFGKTLAHNVAILRGLPRLMALGYPVLLGISRKSMLGELTGRHTPGDRLSGSLAAAYYASDIGVDMLRVHDVAETSDLLRVRAALKTDSEIAAPLWRAGAEPDGAAGTCIGDPAEGAAW